MNTTKFAIVATLIVLGTTACETGKSGAEISALGESLVSETPATVDTPATGPAIDYNPRAALTYAAAVSACQADGRALCSKDQFLAAYAKGDIAHSCTSPINLWLAQAYNPSRNVVTQGCGASDGLLYSQTDVGTKKFYCCL